MPTGDLARGFCGFFCLKIHLAPSYLLCWVCWPWAMAVVQMQSGRAETLPVGGETAGIYFQFGFGLPGVCGLVTRARGMSRVCPSKAGCEQHIDAWQGGFQPVSRFTNILLGKKKINHVTSGLKNASCLCYGKY